MKKLTRIISQSLTGAAAVATLCAGRAMALTTEEAVNAVRADGMPTDLTVVVKNISNTALTLISVVAVVMLIYGGFRYVVSGGDAKKVTDAKNTILYAIIGLVIAFLALAIVNFVIGTIGAAGGVQG